MRHEVFVDLEPELVDRGYGNRIDRLDRGQNRLAGVAQRMQHPMAQILRLARGLVTGDGGLDPRGFVGMPLDPQLAGKSLCTQGRSLLIVAHRLVVR